MIKTTKGTELPTIDLHGKPYLQVAHRIVWFREERPDWRIKTEFHQLGAGHYAKAVIFDTEGSEVVNAHKFVAGKDAKDFEKAETGSVGRALGYLGFGTANAAEFIEDEVVDAPQTPINTQPKQVKNYAPGASSEKSFIPQEGVGGIGGDYVFKGGFLKGKAVRELDPFDVIKQQFYIETKARKYKDDGETLNALEAYKNERSDVKWDQTINKVIKWAERSNKPIPDWAKALKIKEPAETVLDAVSGGTNDWDVPMPDESDFPV